MKRTTREEFFQRQRAALTDALKAPRARTPAELSEHVRNRLAAGVSEHAIARELGWDVDTVRRAAGERVHG